MSIFLLSFTIFQLILKTFSALKSKLYSINYSSIFSA